MSVFAGLVTTGDRAIWAEGRTQERSGGGVLASAQFQDDERSGSHVYISGAPLQLVRALTCAAQQITERLDVEGHPWADRADRLLRELLSGLASGEGVGGSTSGVAAGAGSGGG